MTSSLTETDEASKAVAVAPRISKEFIETQIKRVLFSTGDGFVAGSVIPFGIFHEDAEVFPAPDEAQEEYAHHTICLITTCGGFTVVGHSAPASPENFNAALGRRFAYENAFRQLWPLYAFAMLEARFCNITPAEFIDR
jgi:hypothetical protein